MYCLLEFPIGAWQGRALLLVMAACFLIVCILILRGVSRSRRRKRFEEARRAERDAVFTLPDRENTFIRDRLNTALKTEERRAGKPVLYFMEREGVRLEYSRTLLTRLKCAKLATCDRLETESLSRRLTALALKEGLTGKELRELNELFCLLLKMSAKYSV